MAKTELALVVCDAGPLIHLDELGCVELLGGFSSIFVPHSVWLEVQKHRPDLALAAIPAGQVVSAVPGMSLKLAAVADLFSLDAGEREALQLTETYPVDLFLTDDAAARLAGESLGLIVHGTIGILLRAIRQGYRSREQVLRLLGELPQRSTLHISLTLLKKVIESIEKDQA